MDHKDVRTLIPDYLTSSLDEKSRIVLEEHVKACPHCRKEIELLRPVVQALKGHSAAPPPEKYFNNLLPRIRKRLEPSESRFPLFGPFWTRWLAPLTALGVALVLISHVPLTGSDESNGLRSVIGTLTAEEFAEAFVLQAQQGSVTPSGTTDIVSGTISEKTAVRELFRSILDEESIYTYAPLEALPELSKSELEIVLRRLKERTML